jgi:hypothetical protein
MAAERQVAGEGRAEDIRHAQVCKRARRMSSIYRCHFRDHKDHITVSEDIDVDALTDAIARARAMLEERVHHRMVEI